MHPDVLYGGHALFKFIIGPLFLTTKATEHSLLHYISIEVDPQLCLLKVGEWFLGRLKLKTIKWEVVTSRVTFNINRQGLNKKLVCFRFPTDPAQLHATQKFF